MIHYKDQREIVYKNLILDIEVEERVIWVFNTICNFSSLVLVL